MRSTIYEDIGGEPTVDAAVDALYQRLLADSDLLSYFEGRDVGRLKAHQRALLTVALGGTSEEYAGKMMQPAHAGMAITHQAFDKVLDHLEAVLLGTGVAPAAAAKVLAILKPLRSDVVQSPARDEPEVALSS
jgi:hemoglobin